ncbi:hypothetical protein L208DRAFT_1393391 [Tricholoma matsutake]|nr:hypothetical protein L208DRAFT_1398151 [Tricholoma matsutake 945]KAF8234769.1 hypothetical protein L208DRAFT_1393391 [Tricholoma matsutake 945]
MAAIDANSTLHHTATTEFQAVPKESGWSKRKRILRQLGDALNGCLCGSVLNSTMDGILNCKQASCETQWVSMA